MKYNSSLKTPKKEEHEVPDTAVTDFCKHQPYLHGDGFIDAFLGFEDEQHLSNDTVYGDDHLGLDHFFDFWEGRPICGEEDEDQKETKNNIIDHSRNNFFFVEEEVEEEEEEEEGKNYYQSSCRVIETHQSLGFWDGDGKRVSLNLNLNYQDVLDAWSDRGTLWADDCSVSMPSNGCYMGEVPVMEEEERTRRREASVLRYKEKRQSRLFSKTIRYQVRKLNADKRPRLKGRFVKRGGS